MAVSYYQQIMLLALVTTLVTLQLCEGFYVPGVAPVEYTKSSVVDVRAVKMTSSKTQLPYEYYSVPFCKPQKQVDYKSENLGEILRGDRISNTPYLINMAEDKKCTVLCHGADDKPTSVSLTTEQAKLFQQRILDEYSIHLIADNLPVATPFQMQESEDREYEIGYKFGISLDGKAYINNFLKFDLKFHYIKETDTYRVVGFEVTPQSIDSSMISIDPETLECALTSDQTVKPQIVEPGTTETITFAYMVKWELSEIRWASRWDVYLAMSDAQIHWFNIVNALIIVLLMSGILTIIMVRALRRDIARYNREEDMEETLEESGWKLVHGDIFRPPQHSRLLVSLVGSGIQILCMTFITIALAMLGMLSPASRGSLMTAAIFLFNFMGLFGGYFSARLYRTMKGIQWKSAAVQTAMLIPAITFGTVFVLNFFIWGKKSSGAVPFTTMLALLAIWLGIALPLVFLGYFFGYRKEPFKHPVRTNQIPRQVPEQSWHTNIIAGTMLAGILPFGSVFLELSFIFTAIWKNQFYYMFGFLFLVFVILIITIGQVSIIVVYFQLCAENYHWWWRSFIMSGGPAIYLMLYSVFYFMNRLDITDFIPCLLYFGYSFLIVLMFWLMCATIGFFSAYFFIRKIYSAVKID